VFLICLHGSYVNGLSPNVDDVFRGRDRKALSHPVSSRSCAGQVAVDTTVKAVVINMYMARA
jgi:hypothetical protein